MFVPQALSNESRPVYYSPATWAGAVMHHSSESDVDEEWASVKGVSAIDVSTYEASYEQKVDIYEGPTPSYLSGQG